MKKENQRILRNPPNKTKTIKAIKSPKITPKTKVSNGESVIRNKTISKGEWIIIVISVLMFILMLFVAIRQGVFYFKPTA